jgi:peptide/nickel transport system ATP-binding protein
MCDRVAVMYAGEIVEQADTPTLFSDPKHPYTRGLIGSVPTLGDVRDQLTTIPGSVPNLIDLPAACRFAPRCVPRAAQAVEHCLTDHPELRPAGGSAETHDVRCWIYHRLDGSAVEGARIQ